MDNEDFVIIPEIVSDNPNARIVELLTYNQELYHETVKNEIVNVALKASHTAQQAALKAQYIVMEAVLKCHYALLKAKYENLNAVYRACNVAMKAAHDANVASWNATHTLNLFQNANLVNQVNTLKKKLTSQEEYHQEYIKDRLRSKENVRKIVLEHWKLKKEHYKNN